MTTVIYQSFKYHAYRNTSATQLRKETEREREREREREKKEKKKGVISKIGENLKFLSCTEYYVED